MARSGNPSAFADSGGWGRRGRRDASRRAGDVIVGRICKAGPILARFISHTIAKMHQQHKKDHPGPGRGRWSRPQGRRKESRPSCRRVGSRRHRGGSESFARLCPPHQGRSLDLRMVAEAGVPGSSVPGRTSSPRRPSRCRQDAGDGDHRGPGTDTAMLNSPNLFSEMEFLIWRWHNETGIYDVHANGAHDSRAWRMRGRRHPSR